VRTVYFKSKVTGGGNDALDGINGDLLQDGDAAFVAEGDNFRVYILDANDSSAEQEPSIIAPDTNPETKRWRLRSSSPDIEICYDTWCVAFANESYPVSESTSASFISRHAPDIARNWEHYTRCLARLTASDGTTIESTHGFADHGELISWVNSVIPNSGGYVLNGPYTVTFFDRVNGDVPQLQKVYGVNELYASVFRPFKYRASVRKTAIDSHNSELCKEIIVQGSSHFYSRGKIPCAISSSDYETIGYQMQKMLWCGANKRNLYGLPLIGTRIYFEHGVSNSDPRFWWDCSSKSLVQVDLSSNSHPFEDFAYVRYVPGSPGNVSIVGREDAWTVAQYVYGQPVSIGVLYLVKCTGDSNRFAFYLKPLGIDRVYVDYFDTSKYRLEAVSLWKNHQPLVRVISVPTDIQHQDQINDFSLVSKTQWLSTHGSNGITKFTSLGSFIPPKVKFRLRRLSDNKVGPLTRAGVTPEIRTRNSLIKWVVK